MSTRKQNTVFNEQSLINAIKAFFQDLDIEPRDLKNPTTTVVSNFYSAFLYEMGVDVSSLNQIQNTQMTVISHVDMYNQTIPVINIYQAMSFFFSNIGVNDFCLSDIVNPTPKRTVAQINALMNFLLYCDTAVAKLTPKLEKITSLRQRKHELLSKIETIKEDINQRATNRVKRGENMGKLKFLMEKEKDKFDQHFKEKEIQKQAMENVKKLVLQDEEKEQNLERITKNLQEEIENLSNNIVRSPEKLKTELRRLNEKKEEVVELVKTVKSSIEEKKILFKTLLSETEEQTLRTQKLREVLEIEISIERLNQQLELYLKKHNKFQEDVEEVKQRISNLIQKNESLKIKLEDLKTHKGKQDRENKDKLAEAEKKYLDLVKNKESLKERAYQIQNKIDNLAEEEMKLKLKRNKFIESSKIAYESLEQKEKEIKNNYDQIIEAAKQRNRRLIEDDSNP